MRNGFARVYAQKPHRAAYVVAPGGFYIAALDSAGRVIAEGDLALTVQEARDSAEEFGALYRIDVSEHGRGWLFVAVCRGWTEPALYDMGFDECEQRMMIYDRGTKRA